MREYVVYIHWCKTNNKVYIGLTGNKKPEYRWYKDGHGYINNKHFWAAIQKYGWCNFIHIIYRSGLSEGEAKELERELISIYKSDDHRYGYNQTKGGEGAYYGKGWGDDDYTRRYRKEHEEKLKAYKKRYDSEHHDEIRRYMKDYKKKYYQRNRENILEYEKNRRKNKD